MLTLKELLEHLSSAPDRRTLEEYIEHRWVRPVQVEEIWHFEEIDIARVRLVHHLRHDIALNDDAMDIALHLLDQLYRSREQLRRLTQAIQRQPDSVREELRGMLERME